MNNRYGGPPRPQPVGSALDRRLRAQGRGPIERPAARPAPPPSQPPAPTPVTPPSATGGRTRAGKKWLIAAGTALLLLALAGLIFYLLRPVKPVPPAVARQVSFAILLPTDKQVLAVDRASFAYNAQTSVLSFSGKRPNGTKVSFSEQATPASFVDVPQVYDKLVSSLQPYSTFDSVNGTVSLTHPQELRGAQSAVMNGKGTLLFARPAGELSDNDWRQLFNNLQVNKQ